MSDETARILGHYEGFAEAERLAGDGPGALERERTREILERHLPPPPAVIADVGGGAGIYALPLARRGYRVHLYDLVPRHVEQAWAASKAQAAWPLAETAIADARRLPLGDSAADFVLLLGPLYHLTGRGDRLAALREAYRVLRPGGSLLAAAISRFASTLDGLARDLDRDPAFVAIRDRDLRDGQHRNPTRNPDYFTTAYFHRPEELAAELAEAGFETGPPLGVEGPAWLLADLAERMNESERRARLLDALRRVEAEPALVGVSAHLLIVGKKA